MGSWSAYTRASCTLTEANADVSGSRCTNLKVVERVERRADEVLRAYDDGDVPDERRVACGRVHRSGHDGRRHENVAHSTHPRGGADRQRPEKHGAEAQAEQQHDGHGIAVRLRQLLVSRFERHSEFAVEVSVREESSSSNLQYPGYDEKNIFPKNRERVAAILIRYIDEKV